MGQASALADELVYAAAVVGKCDAFALSSPNFQAPRDFFQEPNSRFLLERLSQAVPPRSAPMNSGHLSWEDRAPERNFLGELGSWEKPLRRDCTWHLTHDSFSMGRATMRR